MKHKSYNQTEIDEDRMEIISQLKIDDAGNNLIIGMLILTLVSTFIGLIAFTIIKVGLIGFLLLILGVGGFFILSYIVGNWIMN